jgi:hypothetical protein
MSNDDARWYLTVVNTHFNRHRPAEQKNKEEVASSKKRETNIIEKEQIFCTDLIIL